MFIELLFTSLLVMSASLIGVVTIWKGAGSIVEKNLHFLISFAAGVFLYLVYALSNEVVLEASSIEVGLFWILLGLVAVSVVVKAIPEAHHHVRQQTETGGRTQLDPRKMLVGDSLHNIGDGVLLAVAFSVSGPLGFATALSLFFHELVQEISEFFVLKEAGYSSKKALAINFVTASTILIGSVGGFFLIEQFSYLEIPLLGLATGALLALLLQDLLPYSVHTMRADKGYIKHLSIFIFGVIAMFAVLTFTGETHAHGHGGHDHAEESHHEEEHEDHDEEHSDHEEEHSHE